MNSLRQSELAPLPERGSERFPARLQSIDLLRGLVMLLMAIDHVRVYSGIPAGSADPGVFFTRWITNFCAPAFAFFAGTAAFLYGRKLAGKNALVRYLVTRGLLLVLLELTVLRFAWTFNFNYRDFTLAGVIWMLGWCMILLAGLVRWLPPSAVGAVGLFIVFCQQLFRFPPHLLPAAAQKSLGGLWEFIYPAGFENRSGIDILYVVVPWIGVMAAGYGFGAIMMLEPGRRRRLCFQIGLSAMAIFLLAGSVSVYRNPAPANGLPIFLRLLNQQKYPASQLFLLMTLGPVIALLPWAESARGWWAGALATIGRVPLFYYLLHIPLIHVAALLVTRLREGQFHFAWYATAPYTFLPPEHRWGLPLLYLVWSVVVVILYFACRWFAGVKSRRQGGWPSYL
jgi:uncharacterized membrane protein